MSRGPILPELCRALTLDDDGALPQRLPFAAAGEFSGRDGRRYLVPDIAALAAAMTAQGVDIPLDWEHATELRGPEGERADAAAWLSDWRVEPNGELTAAVDWTEAGAAAVRGRAYRYYSPAYDMREGTREIAAISSAGLTNKPNLRLPALNREEPDMAIPEPIRRALDLTEDATPEQGAACINTLRAELNSARQAAHTPDLSRYVPRADYDAERNRAAQLETQLRQTQQAETNRRIDALIQQGLETGRITPATVEYHRAQAQTDGGIARLEQYVANAPAVVTDAQAGQGTPPKGTPELNAEHRKIAAAFGLTAQDLDTYAPEEAAR